MFRLDLALESRQKNYKIQDEKLKSSIKQINESKTSLEKELQSMKAKKQKEEKDFLVLHNKKMDTKQKLAPLERLLEEVSGGDEIKTRSHNPLLQTVLEMFLTQNVDIYCFREFSVLSNLMKEIENKKSELQNVRNGIETENAILRYKHDHPNSTFSKSLYLEKIFTHEPSVAFKGPLIKSRTETNNLKTCRDLKNNKQETVSIPSSSILSSPVFLMSVLANIASGGYILYSSLPNRRDGQGFSTGNSIQGWSYHL